MALIFKVRIFIIVPNPAWVQAATDLASGSVVCRYADTQEKNMLLCKVDTSSCTYFGPLNGSIQLTTQNKDPIQNRFP